MVVLLPWKSFVQLGARKILKYQGIAERKVEGKITRYMAPEGEA
jgi:hypothetical protein